MELYKIDLNRVEKDLNLIGTYLLKLKKYSSLSLEEFLSDERNSASCESFLRRCIEAMFDIGRHILSKGFGYKPLEYKEIAKELAQRKIISQDYLEVLIKIAGYRNRMVHFYKEISEEELYYIIKNNLSDIERFVVEISNFIEKLREV